MTLEEAIIYAREVRAGRKVVKAELNAFLDTIIAAGDETADETGTEPATIPRVALGFSVEKTMRGIALPSSAVRAYTKDEAMSLVAQICEMI